MKRAHSDDEDEAPPIPPPSRRKVQFTQTSETYDIKTFKEVIVPGEYDIYSTMRVPSLNNKIASLIQAQIDRNGDLYIEYFVRPHLTSAEIQNYTVEEINALNNLSALHKHGSTHLCALLKKLLAENVVTEQTKVGLDPTPTVRSFAPSHERLQQYYESLSFSYDFDEDRNGMWTTVGSIIARCDEGMQRVRFH